MRVIQRKRVASGFTKSKKEVSCEIARLRREFSEQSEYQDPVKFIADNLEEKGFIGDLSDKRINKYQLVNQFLVINDEAPSLYDSYKRLRKSPNPNYSYDNGGSRDIEDLAFV